MRLRRKVRARKELDVRVDIVGAKELIMTKASGCIMVAGLAFNCERRRTRKCKRTANPVWNSHLRLSLTRGDTSDVIHIAVFDRHRKYSIYLGELRVSMLDLFHDSIKVEPRWYKLYSSKSQNKFVTGSIKVGFELISKKDIREQFRRWSEDVISKEVRLNEQMFYSDTDTDVESMVDDEDDSPLLSVDNLAISTGDQSQKTVDSDTDSDSDSEAIPGNSIIGVVFLDILEASGLPPFKRFIKKGFDMDPFVVISFGKKTFRTSWRKHTLNPKFNQKLAFEIISNEQNFNLLFNILDKDHISYHDEVAFGSIPINDILDGKQHAYNLELTLHKSFDAFKPQLKFNVRFRPYIELKRELWSLILSKYEPLDLIRVEEFLEDSGIEEDFAKFFSLYNKTIEDTLTVEEMLTVLNNENINLKRCPICLKKRFQDIVTHVAICAQSDKLKEFPTKEHASKRWYAKMLTKVAYGKYALGKNNANILVQDRLTGLIMEEKMALYIRLGIRLLYKGKGADTKRIKNVLRNMSLKQGAKFDSPASVKDIEGFIKFYKLDLSECLETDYETFNEFFYRKLKPGARPLESQDSNIITSPADCRCTAFNKIETAQEIWIKGRSFSIMKLLGDSYSSEFENCSIGIFRLAPQDYHRFHSPVDGIIGKPVFIQGEYYTVNPMAIRSHLDVFGENVRVVLPIDSPTFGRVMFISVGAMMVGSTVLTVSEGDEVKRGGELGYFKFGGSTCLVLFQSGMMRFDSDLVHNSNERVETLLRVGMSIGHSNDINELKRFKKRFQDEPKEERLRIIRTITGGDNDRSWEYYNLGLGSDDEEEE
jgi:phosphatidylserine decarboxylase